MCFNLQMAGHNPAVITQATIFKCVEEPVTSKVLGHIYPEPDTSQQVAKWHRGPPRALVGSGLATPDPTGLKIGSARRPEQGRSPVFPQGARSSLCREPQSQGSERSYRAPRPPHPAWPSQDAGGGSSRSAVQLGQQPRQPSRRLPRFLSCPGLPGRSSRRAAEPGHAGVPVIVRPGGSEEPGAGKGPPPAGRAGVRSPPLL